MDIHRKKTKKKEKKKDKDKDKEWITSMYGAWCFWGHLQGSRYTGTLRNCLRRVRVHCECLPLADRLPRRRGKARDGWYQPCCGLNGLSGGSRARSLPLPQGRLRMRMLQDGCSCCAEGKRRLVLSEAFWGHCMTGAFFVLFCFCFCFFGVFGAATICAMCYVAWFLFHKLQSSFVVQLYKLCA